MSGNRVARVIPLIVLGLMALINVGRGCIHAFAPDGGAHSIAGLGLTQNRQTILSLFAILGMQQIVTGVFEMFVLAFRRDLVLMALSFQAALTLAGVINLYFYRVLPVPVPGAPFNAVLLVALLVSLGIMIRGRSGRPDA